MVLFMNQSVYFEYLFSNKRSFKAYIDLLIILFKVFYIIISWAEILALGILKKSNVGS